MATLADLDDYLAQQHKVSSYNDLVMGPLLVHELVVANFAPPAHVVEVPKVRHMGHQVPEMATMWWKGGAGRRHTATV
jgi:hypothetical protein